MYISAMQVQFRWQNFYVHIN